MKRWILISFTMVIALFLVACAGKRITADENSMVIHITNQSNFEFQMVEVSVGLQGGGAMNADNTKIKKGDTLSFIYTDPEDFRLQGRKTFEFVLVDEETRVPLETFTIELAKNKEYDYEITGDTIETAELKLVE